MEFTRHHNAFQAFQESFMNKLFPVIVSMTLLSFPVYAETVGEKTGVNSTLGIAPTTADFVQEAATSDMFEIQASKIASVKLSGPDKEFADQMIADHSKTTNELTDQAKSDSISVPSTMDSAHQKMLAKLTSLNGDDFRKQYLSDQVSAHKDAVSLFERYGKGGDNAKLKDWASTTLPALQHHLDMAQNLYKNT
jgi:putative membrane protein